MEIEIGLNMRVLQEALAGILADAQLPPAPPNSIQNIKVWHGDVSTDDGTLYVIDLAHGGASANYPANVLLYGDRDALAAVHPLPGCYLYVDSKAHAKDRVLNRLFSVVQAHLVWLVRMERAVSMGCDYQELLDTGHEMFDNPIAFLNSAIVCMAKSGELPENLENSIWPEILQNGYVLPKRISKWIRDPSYLPPSRREGVIMGQSANNPHLSMVCDVFADDRHVGMLAEEAITAPFTEKEKFYLHATAQFFSQLAAHRNETSLNSDNGLIAGLIDGKAVSDQLIDSVLKAHGIPLAGWYQAISITTTSGHVSCTSDLADILIEAATVGFDPHFIASFINNRIILVCEYCEPDNPSFAYLSQQLQSMDLHAGISLPYHRVMDSADAIDQAARAIEVAQGGGEVLNFYGNVADADLLQKIDLLGLSSVTKHPDVKLLEQYDTSHETDYVKSLLVYLLCGKNMSEAAQKLFVHRNTLIYRMEKIQSLIKTDIRDETNILFFILALKYAIADDNK